MPRAKSDNGGRRPSGSNTSSLSVAVPNAGSRTSEFCLGERRPNTRHPNRMGWVIKQLVRRGKCRPPHPPLSPVAPGHRARNRSLEGRGCLLCLRCSVRLKSHRWKVITPSSMQYRVQTRFIGWLKNVLICLEMRTYGDTNNNWQTLFSRGTSPDPCGYQDVSRLKGAQTAE